MIQILKSKIKAYLLTPSQLERPELLDIIDESRRYPLTIIQAPAGYGKTTLASQWIKTTTPEEQFIWYSLDKHDNHSPIFFSYLITGLIEYFPDLQPYLNILTTEPENIASILTTIINHICESNQQIFLILDNYETITNSVIHEHIEYLLKYCPPNCHILILSRSLPTQLPIEEMQAYDKVLMIKWKRLRFSQNMILDVLKQKSIRLSDKQLTQLTDLTQGWPLGIQLLSIKLKNQLQYLPMEVILSDIDSFHQQITNSFGEPLFKELSSELQGFLMEICVVEDIHRSLVDTLSEQTNLDKLIHELLQKNLLETINDNPEIYRLHPLLSEWLQRHLKHQSTLERKQYLKAATWFKTQNDYLRALECYLKINDSDQIIELLLEFIPQLRKDFQDKIILDVIDKIPQEILLSHEDLLLAYGLTYLGVNTLLEGKQWLQTIKDYYNDDLTIELNNSLNLLEAVLHLKVPERKLSLATQCLEKVSHLEAQSQLFQAEFQQIKTFILIAQRNYPEIINTYEPLYLNSKTHFSYQRRETFQLTCLYTSYIICGEFEKASAFLSHFLTHHLQHSDNVIFHHLLFSYLANLFSLQNDHELKNYYFNQISLQPINSGYYFETLYLLCELAIREQNFEKAKTCLSQMKYFCHSSHSRQRALESLELDLQLYQGNFSNLDEWINQYKLTPQKLDLLSFKGENYAYRWSYYHFAHKDYESVIDIFDKAIPILEEKQLYGYLTQFYPLKAFAEYSIGHLSQAAINFRKAIELSNKQKFTSWLTHSLCDYKPLLELISLKPHNLDIQYINELQLLLKHSTLHYPFNLEKPVEILALQLSEQENNVFKLLLSDANNKSIANQLFISVNTLKTHNRRIYQKFGVSNRKELKTYVQGAV